MKQDEPLSFNHIKNWQFREYNKLNQAALADKLLISQSAYKHRCYERDEVTPSMDVASKLTDVLDVSLDFLSGKADTEQDYLR